MSTEKKDAVATAKPPTQIDIFHGNLKRYENDLKALLTIHNIPPDKFMTLTLNAVKRMPQLLECEPKTLFGSIMVAAELGLEPNTNMGFAHILPYKRKFKKGNNWDSVLEASFQIGYPGWLEIMYRNPKIESIDTGVIYENEEWYFDKGKREPFSHKPLPPSDRGQNWVAVFAIAWLKDASRPKVIVLYKEDIDKIKALSQGANSEYSPWNSSKDPFLWMPRKTALKQLVKELPKTKEIEKVYHIDNAVETGGTVRLNEETNEVEVLDSDFAKALPANARKENKESAVNKTMASIAAEAKKPEGDPSHIDPEDPAYKA